MKCRNALPLVNCNVIVYSFNWIERSEGQNPVQTLLDSVFSGSCLNKDSQFQGILVPKLTLGLSNTEC